MDKLLEFIVSYVEDIINNENKDKKQIIIIIGLYLLLFILFMCGLLFDSENEVLKQVSISSFYVIIIMTFLGIIGFGGYKEKEKIEKELSAVNKLRSLLEEKYKSGDEIKLTDIQNEFLLEFQGYKDPKDRIKKNLQSLAKDGFVTRKVKGIYKVNQ